MERIKFYIFLGVCGTILLIGFLTMLGFLNSHNYYQEQYYNHLQSLSLPEPIQHYEQKVEEFNKQTEPVINTTRTNVTNSSGINLYPFFKDGEMQNRYVWIWGILSGFLYTLGPRRFMGIPIYNNLYCCVLVSFACTISIAAFGIF